jgi:thioredoxin 1
MRKAVFALCLTVAVVIIGGCGRDERAEQTQTETAKADTVATYATPGMARSGVEDQRDGDALSGGGQPGRVPRIVDLGKGQCIPCKMMAPILEELTEEYRGRVIIEVIDIGNKPEAVKEYGMRVMPTQIFFDAEGNEVWRHEGFLAKEIIVEKLREMGVGSPDG